MWESGLYFLACLYKEFEFFCLFCLVENGICSIAELLGSRPGGVKNFPIL